MKKIENRGLKRNFVDRTVDEARCGFVFAWIFGSPPLSDDFSQ